MTANDSDSDTYLSPAVTSCHQLSPAVTSCRCCCRCCCHCCCHCCSHEHPRRTVSQWDVVPLTRETGHSTLKIYTHARATAHSHARRHMRNPLNSSHARSAAAGVSRRICKTLALLPPACAVMGSSAGSSAAQKSHASERCQSSAARIGTLKSRSQANAQSIEQHTSG